MSAAGEKHSWLLADKHYFGGLYTVKAWGWWCGYTAAQIELMLADAPVIVYNTKKGKKRKPRLSELRATEERYKERQKQGLTRNVSIKDIMGGK